MNVADIAIVLLTITAIARGVELGLVRQLFSAGGVLIGLFLGAWLQGYVVTTVQTSGSKSLLSALVIASCVILGMTVGEMAGLALKRKIHESKITFLGKTDRTTGAVVGGITLLLVVWLCASIFARTPVAFFQQQIQGSVIVSQLNKTLPQAPGVVARLGHLIAPNGFPDVFEGLEPRIDTDKPLPSIGELDPAVQKARASVVKVNGRGCGGVSTGSGFIAAPDLVVTNAHVVAGISQPNIIDTTGRHAATVVWFDPNLDMAVLRSDKLTAEPLAMSASMVPNSSPAAVLGYPGGGDFAAKPATVLSSFVASGHDIYNQKTTPREVYSFKGTVVPGNSGGPLINRNGAVVGLIFAKSTSYEQVGYALTMEAVIDGLEQAKRSQPVGSGSCAAR